MQTLKFFGGLILSMIAAAALAFIIDMGVWLHNIKQDVQACEAFWNEPCVLQPVPQSIATNFSTEYYNDYKAQQKELEKNQ